MPASPQVRPPGWSFPIARVSGVPLRVHATFLVLPALVAWAAALDARPVGTTLAFLALVVGCTVLHELGHAAVARRRGIRANRVTLYPTGGIAWFDEVPPPRDELAIAIAGPLVNVAIAAGIGAAVWVARGPEALTLSATSAASVWGLATAMVWVNLSLAAFNLVPAYPMDGGRIVRATLALRWPVRRATVVAAAVGVGLALVLIGFAVVERNAWTGLLAVMVGLGVVQQARAEQPESRVSRWAAEATLTRFVTLDPEEPLAAAAARTSSAAQDEFPVVDRDGTIVGVLTRRALYRGLEFRGPETRVRDVTRREVPCIDKEGELEAALTRELARAELPILVLEEGRVVGILPAARVREVVDIESARRARGRSAPSSSRTGSSRRTSCTGA